MSDRFKANRRGTPKRRHQPRPLRTTVLIVCEGKETERNYFEELKREPWTSRHFAITVKRGKGGSREQIAQFAIDRKENSAVDFDEVWCVMDVESPAARDEMVSALAQLEQNGIGPCLSNPAFEVWLLAHFERTARAFLDCEGVITQLNGHWRDRFQLDYDKADTRVYTRLAGLVRDAIRNAKWVRETHHSLAVSTLDCNSATDVYRLVAEVTEPSE